MLRKKENNNINEQNFHLKNRKEQSQLDKGYKKPTINTMLNIEKVKDVPLKSGTR